MWIHCPFFPKTWTKDNWPLDDLWPHDCWGHMCDSTQRSLCPSPMGIHQCMWIQWWILQNDYILRTTYRMSDHIVSYWTQFRETKNCMIQVTKSVNNSLNLYSLWNRWPINNRANNSRCIHICRTIDWLKGVLHPWALFLKTLCIFLKNKATSDKVSHGSGQKCSMELKNHSFTSIETIVVKLQWKMCENQYFPCFEP